jgi:FMN reductase
MLVEINNFHKIGAPRRPLIVGVGGTIRPNSTTEQALRRALFLAEQAGAETELFSGAALQLPLYNPNSTERTSDAELMIHALRRADAVIFASPAYHGSLSGLVKNAIDYIEDMRRDARPYLEDRAVGSIVSAYGDQALGATLSAFRNITHALRGWPLPIGVGINALRCKFGTDHMPSDAHVEAQLLSMVKQAITFSHKMRVEIADYGQA